MASYLVQIEGLEPRVAEQDGMVGGLIVADPIVDPLVSI